METNSECMGTAFSEWQDLSSAYSVGIAAMRRGESGAALNLMRLSRLLQLCEGAVEQHRVRRLDAA